MFRQAVIFMKKIRNIFKQKADYYDQILEGFNQFREVSYGSNLELLKWFSDFSIFTLLGSYDLWIILCDYQNSVKKYQQNYYARQASLVCFELLSDVAQHFNVNYTELMINKINDPEINYEAKRIRKLFNKSRNENESKFKKIRDLTIAHRDHNISDQIVIINNMDNEWIMRFSLEYLQQIEELHILMNNIIKYIGKELMRLDKNSFLQKYTV